MRTTPTISHASAGPSSSGNVDASDVVAAELESCMIRKVNIP